KAESTLSSAASETEYSAGRCRPEFAVALSAQFRDRDSRWSGPRPHLLHIKTVRLLCARAMCGQANFVESRTDISSKQVCAHFAQPHSMIDDFRQRRRSTTACFRLDCVGANCGKVKRAETGWMMPLAAANW